MNINFSKLFLFALATLLLPLFFYTCESNNQEDQVNRPNILLLMSDNHSWNHLGVYGDPVVKTPNIDRIAIDGVKFTHAFCAAPSCSPARAGMLAGQDIWRLEEAANLNGIFPTKFPLYTDLLREVGYLVGRQGKAWAPGNIEANGRKINPGGVEYQSFVEFMKSNTENSPWTFWFSSVNPHRPYDLNSGKASGMDLNQIVVPPYLPDTDEVRGDIADYLLEIEDFDEEVGRILSTLKESGQWDNTIIIICGDNGWQMPRGLANLYDFGMRIPMIFYWKGHIPGNRTVDDFVNMNDFAPTFLEINNIPIPSEMTATGLSNILFSDESGRIEQERDFIVTARERHAPCRLYAVGYPGRAIRTYDYLFIRNYEPDRWPAGDPPLFGDVDAHKQHYHAPTKNYILLNKDKPEINFFYKIAFDKRSSEELYDVENDPGQMNNLAYQERYLEIKESLSNQMDEYLRNTKDPRALGQKIIWDSTRHFNLSNNTPRPSKEMIEMFGLKEQYNYFPDSD